MKGGVMVKIKLGKHFVVNLCDHRVFVEDKEGYIVEFPPNKKPKPILQNREVEVDVGLGVKSYQTIPDRILNLPPKEEGVYYIVPHFIVTGVEELYKRGEMEKRDDLLSPGKKILGEGGKIEYVKGLRLPRF